MDFTFLNFIFLTWKIRIITSIYLAGFPGGSVVKTPCANAGDTDSIPGSGRLPGEGNGNPLQYFCLRNPMDRGAWWATVHGDGSQKSQSWLSDWTITLTLLETALSKRVKSLVWEPDILGFSPGSTSHITVDKVLSTLWLHCVVIK